MCRLMCGIIVNIMGNGHISMWYRTTHILMWYIASLWYESRIYRMRTSVTLTGVLRVFFILFSYKGSSRCMAFLNAPSCSHLGINLRQSTTPEPLNLSTYCTRSDSSAYRRACPFWSAIWSRTSIETVIHTGDCDDYDVNCVQYRKARYWRELSTPDLEEVC